MPSEVVWPVPPLSIPMRSPCSSSGGRRGTARRASATSATSSGPAPVDLHPPRRPAARHRARRLRLRRMPLSELAVGLDDRFRVLSRGARTALPRQQTLRAVVDWSYDLLFDDERRVLDRLSVFTGGCALAAARVVCADDDISADDVAELLTRLADKSLLTLEEPDAAGTSGAECSRPSSTTAANVWWSPATPHASAPRTRATTGLCPTQRGGPAGWTNGAGFTPSQPIWATCAPCSSRRGLRRRGDRPPHRGLARMVLVVHWPSARGCWLALGRARCEHADGEATRARLLAWTVFTGAPGFVLWADPDELASAVDASAAAATSTSSARRRSRCTGRRVPSTSSSAWRRRSPSPTRPGATTPRHATCCGTPNGSCRSRLRAVELRRCSPSSSAGGPSSRTASRTPRRRFRQRPPFEALGGEVYCRSRTGTSVGWPRCAATTTPASQAIDAALRLARELGLSAFVNVLLTDLAACLAAAGDFGSPASSRRAARGRHATNASRPASGRP